uniref:EOG090X087A n=1 Tax=Alona affinis TaxID=381656 RepID=A0A9N6ZEU1_9CRUS|nr:EOG090X087A [Alona affinis]
MNLQTVLQDFNPGKFVVYLCLLIFSSLICLRLDDVIKTSYWAIFAPLWAWKFLAFVGAAVGMYAWWRKPASRIDTESYIHFKSMLLSMSLHLLLLFFEFLACDKLESKRHIWVLVFLPLYFLSILCIAVSIWALKHERPFEIELLGAVNLLQLIFIALRLDGFILWNWDLVFIPLWIIFGVALIVVLYTGLLAAILVSWSSNMTTDQRRASSHGALGFASLVIPSLASLIMLTKKLDGHLDLPYSIVIVPFLMALTSLVLRSFNARSGNMWWCGMQKDCFLFLMDVVPSLREYGNVSYHQSTQQRPDDPESASLSPSNDEPSSGFQGSSVVNKKNRNSATNGKADISRAVVVPILAIDIPD